MPRAAIVVGPRDAGGIQRRLAEINLSSVYLSNALRVTK
jgi:hypothetical protein